MSTLTNQQIDATYAGLIKTTDNAAITATPKALEDGLGNTLPIEVSTTGVNFTGTVTGITTGGLVPGTGINSMRSSDALTTTPAICSGSRSVAMGEDVVVLGSDSVAIGNSLEARGGSSVMIGRGIENLSNTTNSISIGTNLINYSGNGTLIGHGASNSSNESVVIGNGALVSGGSARSVAIGRNAKVYTPNSIAIGNFAKILGDRSIAMASCSLATQDSRGDDSIMIVPGRYGCTTANASVNSIVLGASNSNLERVSNVGGIAIGVDTQVTADNAVALGADVIANIANTTSVTELETQLDGGGIVMYSPNGTGYKLTVSDAGAAVFTAI